MVGDLTRRIEFLKQRGVVDSRGRVRLPGGGKVSLQRFSTQEVFDLARQEGFEGGFEGQGISGRSGRRASARTEVVKGEATVKRRIPTKTTTTPKDISSQRKTQFKPQDPTAVFFELQPSGKLTTLDGRPVEITQVDQPRVLRGPLPAPLRKPSKPILQRGLSFLEEQRARAQFTQKRAEQTGDITSQLKSITVQGAVGSARSVLKLAQIVKSTVTDPIGTAKSVGLGIVSVVKNPRETLESVGKKLREDPISSTTELATDLVVTPKVARRAFLTARGVAVVAKKPQFIGQEKLFDVKVLEGKSKFPVSKSGKVALEEFEKARLESGKVLVTSTAPSPLKGTEVKAGPAALAGKEDPGLFVTPAGRGSPHFLGLTKKPSGISIIPTLPRPTVINVEVTDVARQPSNILRSPGFRKAGEFLRKESKTGKAFITKRSETGQTPELEAIIPEGTLLKELPSEGFTVFKGTVVPVRRFRTVPTAKSPTGLKTIKEVRDLTRRTSLSSVGGSKPSVGARLPAVLRSSSRGRSSSRASNISSFLSSRKSSGSSGASSLSSGVSSSITRLSSGFSGISSSGTSGSSFGGSSSSSISRLLGSSSGGSSRSFFTGIPPTTTTTIKIPRLRKRTSRKKPLRTKDPLTRISKFQPSIVGIETRTKRKRRDFLTGLEIRGI